jgi:hypothetical protein
VVLEVIDAGSNCFLRNATTLKLRAVLVYAFVNLLFKRFKTERPSAKGKKNIFAAPFSNLNPIV